MIEVIQLWMNLTIHHIIQIVMTGIIQLWMNLKVHQYHPNKDDQNHPTIYMDESKYEPISSK